MKFLIFALPLMAAAMSYKTDGVDWSIEDTTDKRVLLIRIHCPSGVEKKLYVERKDLHSQETLDAIDRLELEPGCQH